MWRRMTTVEPDGLERASTDRYAGSRTEFARRRRTLARGVATNFRADQRPVPLTFVEGRGARLRDLDGNEYVDYALAFGPLVLGHSPEPVLAAVRRQLSAGIAYGASHPLEAQLAEAVCRAVPCAELCVFSSTGSEAVHAALRIARAATGRTRVIKFLGHFHGWLDPLAVGNPGRHDAGPATAGQDPLASSSVSVLPWNDIEALRAGLGDDVAAVIMEPVAVNGGCFTAAPGYLEAVRELTERAGALLIFDEVITGFRLSLGGAQERCGVIPDMAVLGKALGAGFPISAVCGRADVMELVASGTVAHVGTFNGSPICTAAALASIQELERRADEIYPQLDATGSELAGMLRDEATEAGLPLVVNQMGGAAHAFASSEPIDAYADTTRADPESYRRFAEALLAEGVHVISRGLLYVSTAHGQPELERTRAAVRRAAASAGALVRP